VAENLSPCILWTDEVDQALGQRSTGQSGDSGTSERMLARIFEFFGSMQHRGKILWVASTNRPDILDPALLDRFQVIVPFIHPSRKERIQILPLLAKQIDRKIDPNIDISKIAGLQNLDLFTIRSLQEIIVRAGMYADTETQSPGSLIQEKHFHLAINDYKPTYNPVEHKFIALKALEMTTFNSLLPWMSSNYEREDIPSYIRGLVDINTGHLDPSKLSARIAELQKMLYSQRILR
jgi:SpoVK/Ycf46/Vps4 family AAA+-type ATPase